MDADWEPISREDLQAMASAHEQRAAELRAVLTVCSDCGAEQACPHPACPLRPERAEQN